MRASVAAVIVGAALLVAGCGGGSKSSAPAGTTQPPEATTAPAATGTTTTAPAPAAGRADTCLDVPAALVRTLQTHIVLVGGKVTHVKAVTSRRTPGFYFVSGRVDGGGVKRGLATWATQRLSGTAPIYAVDSAAALVSLYGGAIGKDPDLRVTAPGAYKSRVCVAGPNAFPGTNAPVGGGGNAPATK
jgi:hypothetical protein